MENGVIIAGETIPILPNLTEPKSHKRPRSVSPPHTSKSSKPRPFKHPRSSGLCETCGSSHDGSFGRGRFCSMICRNKFASSFQGHVIRHREKIAATTPPSRARSVSPSRTKPTSKSTSKSTSTSTSTSKHTSTSAYKSTPTPTSTSTSKSTPTSTSTISTTRTIASITADIKQERALTSSSSITKHPRTWTNADIDMITSAIDTTLRSRLQSILTSHHYTVSNIVTYAFTQSTTSYGACCENLSLYLSWPSSARTKYYRFFTVAWIQDSQPMLQKYLETVEGSQRSSRSSRGKIVEEEDDMPLITLTKQEPDIDPSDTDSSSEDIASHIDITIRDTLITLKSELTPADICLRALHSTHASIQHDCRMIQALMNWKVDSNIMMMNTNSSKVKRSRGARITPPTTLTIQWLRTAQPLLRTFLQQYQRDHIPITCAQCSTYHRLNHTSTFELPPSASCDFTTLHTKYMELQKAYDEAQTQIERMKRDCRDGSPSVSPLFTMMETDGKKDGNGGEKNEEKEEKDQTHISPKPITTSPEPSTPIVTPNPTPSPTSIIMPTPTPSPSSSSTISPLSTSSSAPLFSSTSTSESGAIHVVLSPIDTSVMEPCIELDDAPAQKLYDTDEIVAMMS